MTVVVLTPVDERVRLIDEKHTVKRLVNEFVGFDGGLTDIFGNQPRAIGLHQMPLLEDTQRVIDLRDAAGDCGLASARIADEDAVVGEFGDLQPRLLTFLRNFAEVRQFVYLGLDLLQPDELVKFGKRLLQRRP